MFTGVEISEAFKSCGITHVVWIPDSEIGKWNDALEADNAIQLIRPTREGEAIVLAAGLLLGGKRPIVCIQCTGLFEAGDALRNVIHDLKLPLFLIIGVRSYFAHQEGRTADSCPVFTEPILQAWQLPYRILMPEDTIDILKIEYQQAKDAQQPFALLYPE